MITARFAPILFGFILSGLMSAVVSEIATARVLDAGSPFIGQRFGSWISSWLVAFPAVLLIAPSPADW
ncbi:DUF2798 domain-containing protein [Octadecabacter sp.]|nr:DUF2798 domain-containing protein [Octadecabacter sp.]